MLDGNGQFLAHPDSSLVLEANIRDFEGMRGIGEEMLKGRPGASPYVFQGITRMGGFAPINSTGWYIFMAQNEEEYLSNARDIRKALILVMLISIAAASAAIGFVSRSIVSPVKKAVAGLRDIAEGDGDLTMRLEVSTKDEAGELALWFNTFVEKLQGIIGNIGNNIHSLTASSVQLAAIAQETQERVQDVSGRAGSVAAASEEMSANTAQSTEALQQSSHNTSLLATATEEMSATIREIAQNSGKARAISQDAAGRASRVSISMDNLEKAAGGIGRVIETITDISAQVNLLALNATIEAARAGDAGKGFAVVANEIKQLATQTAEAARDISDKIQKIQETTSASVKDVAAITSVINDVSDVVGGIAAAVEEQSAAAEEIADNVGQVSRSIELVHENASENSLVVEQVARDIAGISHVMGEMQKSGSQVSASASDLSGLSESIKKLVEQFRT
ncbi:methyl-accepting chemotaxis protein [Desulfobotulus mexicanus]|uniref:HAMP domain-containing protein n=1 Tax=Desulfobotulus mexicanus TaxID=2586642 RepID=A0A5Q4VEG2_9BACT|nr:methyl-accepting chemotaxis protein [Desulfobotulus mexicanus]TYT76074.1 HAMP domain-containing protein [Desulfobotulus mexicanus]